MTPTAPCPRQSPLTHPKNPDPTTADLAILQGTWVQVSMEEDGILNPPDTHGAPGATVTIRGNSFSVTSAEGQVLLTGLFELDATTTPKSVTWIDSIGPDAGKRLPASYTIDPNHFTFIAANEGAPRPTIFRTTPGQTMRAFVRRR